MRLPKFIKSPVIKLGISAILLYIAVRSAGWENVRAALKQIPPYLIVIATIGYTLTQVINTLKWRLLVLNCGQQVDVMRAIRASFVGMYVNCFGLGTLGGDVVRALLISPDPRSHPANLAIVVIDRLMGMSVLAAIGVVAALSVNAPIPIALEVISGVLAAAAVIGLLFARTLLKHYRTTLPQKLLTAIELLPTKSSVLMPIVGMSVLFHFSQISLFWLLAELAGFAPSFLSLIAIIPFVNIAATLPLSWMGAGIRESALIALAVPYVFDREEALVTSLIWTSALIISSALGAVLFGAKVPKKEIEEARVKG